MILFICGLVMCTVVLFWQCCHHFVSVCGQDLSLCSVTQISYMDLICSEPRGLCAADMLLSFVLWQKLHLYLSWLLFIVSNGASLIASCSLSFYALTHCCTAMCSFWTSTRYVFVSSCSYVTTFCRHSCYFAYCSREAVLFDIVEINLVQ